MKPLKTQLILLCFLTACYPALGQVAPDCATAIPICSNTPVSGGVQGFGADDFSGMPRPGCLAESLSGHIESNSAWYRFRTGAAGQLGFNISFDTSEDWDFALYRASDCGSLGEPVRCNFFDNQDREAYMGVGEDPTGNVDSYLYEPWLEVAPGEDYYLFINNFSNTNSGFSVQFSGSIFQDHPGDALDCSIIDNLLGPPRAACEGTPVVLDATTPGATGYEWFKDHGSGFVLIPGAVSATYPVSASALYRVRVSLGGGSQVISDVQVAFSPPAEAFPIADLGVCEASATLDLHLLDPQALGPQPPEAYLVSYHLSQEEAEQGSNPLPAQWAPGPGSQTLHYRVTSRENPLCYDASRSFDLVQLTPPALDLPQEAYLCLGYSPPLLGPLIPEPGVTYLWSTGEQTSRIAPAAPGSYTLTATRTEGGLQCQVSGTVEVIASVPPAIEKVVVQGLQAQNTVTVVPLVEGSFEYAINDGPYQSSPVLTGVPPGTHQLHMRDTVGCGSLSETITVVGFTTFFTPNGDGQHDLWKIYGLEYLSDPEVFIFDRYGKLLKQLDQTSAGWDGTFNGKPLPATDYWFRLNYTDAGGQRVTARYLQTHFALKR